MRHRVKKPDWRVTLSCPSAIVTSMNGVTLHAQSTLAQACKADAVLFGSGMKTRDENVWRAFVNLPIQSAAGQKHWIKFEVQGHQLDCFQTISTLPCIAKVNFDVCCRGETLVGGHLFPPIPRQRFVQYLRYFRAFLISALVTVSVL